jgi:hypothetical protein
MKRRLENAALRPRARQFGPVTYADPEEVAWAAQKTIYDGPTLVTFAWALTENPLRQAQEEGAKPRCPRHRELSHPELGFYTVGVKSYGWRQPS